MGRRTKWGDPTTNLDAVTTTTAGSAVRLEDDTHIRVLIKASSVTSGGTVLIQGSDDGGTTWYTVDTTTVSADGTTIVVLDEVDLWQEMRTNLSARTDGTYTTTISRRQ